MFKLKNLFKKGYNGMNPIVTFQMANGKVFKAELYPESAPNTVNNFIHLIKKKYYNGLIFHRVISGFMIQGGDPEGTGMGGPGLSMARSGHPNSAGSQFFVMHEDAPHLDGQYAAFGCVIEGMEVVDEIANVKTDWNDKPLKPQKIKKVTVETFGANYPNPTKV